jgi:hypothetical protein
MMKKTSYFLTLFIFFSGLMLIGTTQSSCSRGYGCEMQEHANTDYNEKLNDSKRGKSNLFPKRMRKQMK